MIRSDDEGFRCRNGRTKTTQPMAGYVISDRRSGFRIEPTRNLTAESSIDIIAENRLLVNRLRL